MYVEINHCRFDSNVVVNGSGAALTLRASASTKVFNITTISTRARRQLQNEDSQRFPTELPTDRTNAPSMIPTFSPTFEPTSGPTNNPTQMLHVEASPLRARIENCLFSNNYASNRGGSVYASIDGWGRMEIELTSNKFNNNSAGESGGSFAYQGTYDAVPTNGDYSFNGTIKNCSFENNEAKYGGSISVNSSPICDISLKDQKVKVEDSVISNSMASTSGGGIYASCMTLVVESSDFVQNRVVFDTSESSTTLCNSDTDCYDTIALRIKDNYGGLGAGMYVYNSDLNVTNCKFDRNVINIGNGGAIYRQIDVFDFGNGSYLDKYQSLESLYEIITLSLIISKNTFTNCTVGATEVLMSESNIECSELSGLSGFGGAVWLDIKEDFTNEYFTLSGDTIEIKDNSFDGNTGQYVNDLYFNLYYRLTLNTMDLLQITQFNTFVFHDDDSSDGNSVHLSSTPTSLSGMTLLDGTEHDDNLDCEKSEGCLGFVQPGDVFQISYQLKDYWSNYSPVIASCAQLVYNISEDYLDIESVSIEIDDMTVKLQLDIQDAEYDTRVFVNVTDLHYIMASMSMSGKGQNDKGNPRDGEWSLSDYHKYYYNSYSLLTALCPVGWAVTIYSAGEGNTICSADDMTGLAFSCNFACSDCEYLFTKYEPKCHSCPKNGAACPGTDIVTLSYGYYGLLKTYNETYDSNDICIVAIDTYICPWEICCSSTNGCEYDNTDSTVLCARNRDPEYPFCGACNDGYSETYGSYNCIRNDECTETKWGLLVLSALGCMVVLLYLLYRDPRKVTPLFVYICKTLLYFYQILPIISNKSSISIVSNISTAFSLDFIATTIFSENGTCILPQMSSIQKLLLNFITPIMLLVEVSVLALITILVTKGLVAIDGKSTPQRNSNMHEESDISNSLLQMNVKDTGTESDKISKENTKPTAQKTHFAPLLSRRIGKTYLTQFENEDKDINYDTPSTLGWERVRKCNNRLNDNLLDTFWNAILIVYMTIAHSTMKIISCCEIDGVYYMWYAGQHKCSDYWWRSLFIILFICITIFPIGIVFALWYIRQPLNKANKIWSDICATISCSRQDTDRLNDTSASVEPDDCNSDVNAMKENRFYTALTSAYNDTNWWYESILIGRRFILVCCYAFPIYDSYFMRAIIVFLCTITLIVHIRYLPFKYKINNYLEVFVLAMSILISALSIVGGVGVLTDAMVAVFAIVPLAVLPLLIWKYCSKTFYPTLLSFRNKKLDQNKGENEFRCGGDIDDGLNNDIDIKDLDVDQMKQEIEDLKQLNENLTKEIQILKEQ